MGGESVTTLPPWPPSVAGCNLHVAWAEAEMCAVVDAATGLASSAVSVLAV